MAVSHTPAKPKANQKPITTAPTPVSHVPVKPKAGQVPIKVLTPAQRAAANVAAHKSTPAQRAANQAAHVSTPAQRAANVAAHQPSATKTPSPKPPVKPVLTPAQQHNIAAHQSTAAQRALNVQLHTPGYHAVHIPDPNADPDFMQTKADLTNQLNTYKQQEQHGITQYQQQYNQSEGALGFNPATKAFDPNNLTPGTYGAAMRDTNNDYTSRGMGASTPYATAVQQMGNDYAHRANVLTTGMNSYNQSQNDSLLQYQAQNTAALNNARRTAVANIASQYGVQPTSVKPGQTNTLAVANP